ncbi:YfhO family protein [Sediminibacillus massiliensis]|uniref:YfhO family protein n=1 Tax=Sediminibacillus massiliensis TaxID=1926277 RepID=UPI0009884D84|nr:YfhO family protein [Sediminibacillus massiliensis]
MKNSKKILLLVFVSLITAILAHGFFLIQWANGVYMAGPNDGLSQMVPFRKMLYEQFTSGNFFYSFEFGLGGSTYTQLAYYYGLNIFFFITVLILYGFELLSVIGQTDILFWAQATVFISIIRLMLVLVITTSVFRYMRISLLSSFTGAVLYGLSGMYFRHVTYWEFFGDAFLWLPLLVLGVEKVIREKQPVWLTVAIAISLFDNFYFAFINFCFIGVYIICRSFLTLGKNEADRIAQWKMYFVSGLLGFGIGSVGFVPSVYGFFQNYRPDYQQYVPRLDMTSNILFDSRLLIVPAVFVLFSFVFTFYKNLRFRLFAMLSLLIIVLHFVPLAASFFNGMSAPQHRYEYLASFAIGGAVASGLELLRRVTFREMIQACILTFYLYLLFFMKDASLNMDEPYLKRTILPALAILIITMLVRNSKNKWIYGMLLLVILTAQIIHVNDYQKRKLYETGNVEKVTKDYILSENYYSEEQSKLIDRVLEADPAVLPRLEWKTDGRNNTPIIQDFAGTSVYSSILNKEILYFYYHDLEIDMKRESVSRYSGFGDRANLYSRFGGKYIMYKKEKVENVPYGFEKYMSSANYVVYKNANSLPFVQTSSNIFSEKELESNSIPEREHAMLQGIVLEEYKGGEAATETVPDIFDQVDVKPVNAGYRDNQLVVKGETGGLDFHLENPPESAKDYYLSFHLQNNSKSAPAFPLHVDNFKTSRKSRQSIYRTKVDDITIRIPRDEVISLRVPEGNYTIKNFQLYPENYQVLKDVKKSTVNNDSNVSISGNKIEINIENKQNDKYLAIPVPHEKGWQVYVNGEKHPVKTANYAFLGTAIDPGRNKVIFVYYPPYFKTTMAAALVSTILIIIWRRRTRKRTE